MCNFSYAFLPENGYGNKYIGMIPAMISVITIVVQPAVTNFVYKVGRFHLVVSIKVIDVIVHIRRIGNRVFNYCDQWTQFRYNS